MKENGLLRPFVILLLATLFAYFLTGTETYWGVSLGWKVKVFDPLSDILLDKDFNKTTELSHELSPIEEPTPIVSEDVEVGDSLASLDSPREREKTLVPDQVLNTGISDFSATGDAKERLLSILLQARIRPVYIAFLGDSFIEGDILVAPLRNKLQERFGGRGVGYMPLTSATARFRNTIDQRFSGDWKSITSLRTKRNAQFSISEQFQFAKGKAEVSYRLPKSPANLSMVDQVTLSMQATDTTIYTVSVNGGDFQNYIVNGDSTSTNLTYQLIAKDSIKALTLRFPDGFNGRLHGLFFDDTTGISVDNFSLRGSSGLQLSQVSTTLATQMNHYRPYSLIIFSYGLNVVSTEENNDTYGWYYTGMDKALAHLKRLYPESIFLILSVSDRATIVDGEVVTLSGISKVLRHQERLARKHECLFWNTYQRMQEDGGIKGYVSKGWAAKDYTHISYGGGRQLSKFLLQDLIGDE